MLEGRLRAAGPRSGVRGRDTAAFVVRCRRIPRPFSAHPRAAYPRAAHPVSVHPVSAYPGPRGRGLGGCLRVEAAR
jgi:hypothetical protein